MTYTAWRYEDVIWLTEQPGLPPGGYQTTLVIRIEDWETVKHQVEAAIQSRPATIHPEPV